MFPVSMVLLIIAFVLFLVAAVGVTVSKINLMAAGLAVWVASEFFVRFVH